MFAFLSFDTASPCYSAPCLNGGTCKKRDGAVSKTISYKCICSIGFTGDNCERKGIYTFFSCRHVEEELGSSERRCH